MITESKVIVLFCMADDFCKFFDIMMAKYTLKPATKRKYHRDSTRSKAEIMLIMILFHDSGYRCLKHFYLEKSCKHVRHFFPKVVSYNRFVELEKKVAIPLVLFIKKVLLGKCTGFSFVDSTPLCLCKNQRIHIHKTFKGIAQRGKCSIVGRDRFEVLGTCYSFKIRKKKRKPRTIDYVMGFLHHSNRGCQYPVKNISTERVWYNYQYDGK